MITLPKGKRKRRKRRSRATTPMGNALKLIGDASTLIVGVHIVDTLAKAIKK